VNPRSSLRARLRPALLALTLLWQAVAQAADLPATAQCEGSAASYDHLVIIIDDIGNDLARGRDAVALPGKLTYAVMPFTPHGAELAEAAHAAGKEVMLHEPMSTGDERAPDRGTLTPQHDRQAFRTSLVAALATVPHVRGVNNHMGSELTAQRRPMAWLMRELRWRELYFVDSRTTDLTVAATVAAEFNVPNLSRQVFLDNDIHVDAIDARFQELLALARQDGMAVAIGHPYRETIDYLRRALPPLEEQGVRLALVSEALELIERDRLREAVAATNDSRDPGC